MTTAYTSLLGLALPVQGELSGTWGDMVDNAITSYVDVAVAGTQTISGSQTAVTLSITNGTSSATNIAQAGSGSTGSAQFAIINCTGNPASLLTITAPASSRQYTIVNATSTSQSVKIVGSGPTTGVTIVSGEKATVVWNGSDYVKVASTVAGAAAGSNTQVQYNNSGNLAGSANLTFNGTTLTANTLALTNALGSAYGGTGLTSFTANGVLYASSSSLLATGSALNFDGTNLGLGTSSGAGKLTIVSTTNPALVLPNIAEVATVSATAATGTINYDVTTQSVLYYTTDASANWTLNVRGNSTTSLNTLMATGQSMTIAFLVTNGSTAYYASALTIDGSSVTPKWQGGTTPSSGSASAVDIYTYTIIKTGSAAYTVFASQTKFA
jgi:hypothetical protein